MRQTLFNNYKNRQQRKQEKLSRKGFDTKAEEIDLILQLLHLHYHTIPFKSRWH